MSQMIEERGLLNLRVEPQWPTAIAGDKVWKHTQVTKGITVNALQALSR